MGSIVANLGESITKQFSAYVDLPKVVAPNTTILNRATVTDFSNDLLPKMGIDRIEFMNIQELQNEVGANGERIWKLINDVHDQIRFVGPDWGGSVGTPGQQVSGGDGVNTGNYMEVIFYGTGLNLLYRSGTGQDYRATVDGGAEGANFTVTANTVLDARNYSSNTMVSAVSGLTLGLHSVKIRDNSANARWLGIEIVNASGTSPNTLQLLPGNAYSGSSKLSKAALTVDSFNSNFETTLGTPGTRGGHVVVYVKQDGTVGKAIRYTETASAFLTSATHANESIIRPYYTREFGSGRNDDFSLTVPTNADFTLDDGTTSLKGQAVQNAINGSAVGINNNGVLMLTFVGTGLDLVRWDDNNPIGTDHSQNIDGTSIGNTGTTGYNFGSIVKVASGLPYGTHTYTLTRLGSGGADLGAYRFLVYGPSKPSIPTGAVELCDYYIMGNYSATTAAGFNTIGTGMLRKRSEREFLYTGTGWSAGFDTNSSGWDVQSNVNGDAVTYWFYGTGFEFRFDSALAGTQIWQFTVDGSTNLSGFTTSTVGAGVASFVAATGTLTSASSATYSNILSVSNMTLGFHKVVMTRTGGTYISFFQSLDIITPIHSQKSTQPGAYQNALTSGNQGISDSRKFSTTTVKSLSNWVQAFGISSNPTTTSTVLVPVPDMSCIIRTTGNPIEIYYSADASSSATAVAVRVNLYVDGVAVGKIKSYDEPANLGSVPLSDSIIVPVAAGVHSVQLFWEVSSGTGTMQNDWRTLKVREIG